MTQSHCSPYPVIQIEWLQAARKTNPIRDEDFFTIRWQEAGVAHRLIG